MAEDDKENFFGILETRGEAKVRAMLESGEWGARERLVREWLQIKSAENRTEQELQALRAVAAAERSATASETSAAAARTSARAAILAVVVAVVAIICSSRDLI